MLVPSSLTPPRRPRRSAPALGEAGAQRLPPRSTFASGRGFRVTDPTGVRGRGEDLILPGGPSCTVRPHPQPPPPSRAPCRPTAASPL